MIKRFLMYFALFGVLTVLLISQACDDTPLNSYLPDENIIYDEHLHNVFELKCNNAGCHNSQDRAGGLALTSCDETKFNPLIVSPFNPGNSTLVWAIEGQSGAKQMPPLGYEPLTANERNAIKVWIAEGAKCN